MQQLSASTVKVLRWTARVLGLFIILFFVSMYFSEDGITNSYGLHLTRDMLPINWMLTLVSYVLAWKWERLSGIVIVGVYLIHGILEPAAFLSPLWIVMAIPGLLFIICSMKQKPEPEVV
jgi:hypothetical protein